MSHPASEPVTYDEAVEQIWPQTKDAPSEASKREEPLTESIESIVPRLNKSILYIVCLVTEQTLQYPISYERIEEEILLPFKSVLLNLLSCHAERRLELSEKSVNAMDRNLPDTEETKHMVDSIGIEILCHIRETTNPPLAVVL